jgi:hypothetical protein
LFNLHTGFRQSGHKIGSRINNKTKIYSMSVNNKHLATFLLGAAAAFGAYKYVNMSDEEKEKMAATLKDKANKLKDQAVAAEDKAMDYFNELKTKGGDAFNEHMPKMEEFFNNLFGGSKAATAGATAAGTQAGGNPSYGGSTDLYTPDNTSNNNNSSTPTGSAGI